MRHAGRPARLEHAHARLDRERDTVGVAQPDPPPVAGEQAAYRARAEHAEQGRGEAEQHPPFGRVDPGGPGRIGPVLNGSQALEPSRLGHGHGAQLAAAVGEPDQRQDRQEHGDGQQPRLGGEVPRAQAQPEMNADAAVQPDDDQHHALARRPVRPQRVQHIGIAVVDPEQLMGAAGAEHVDHQPERDQEAERGLDQLPRRHPQAAPAPELAQRERHVGRERRVEEHGSGERAPYRCEDPAAGLHRRERVDAERVVQQMRAGKRHQHQARGQPQLRCDVGTGRHDYGQLVPALRRRTPHRIKSGPLVKSRKRSTHPVRVHARAARQAMPDRTPGQRCEVRPCSVRPRRSVAQSPHRAACGPGSGRRRVASSMPAPSWRRAAISASVWGHPIRPRGSWPGRCSCGARRSRDRARARLRRCAPDRGAARPDRRAPGGGSRPRRAPPSAGSGRAWG